MTLKEGISVGIPARGTSKSLIRVINQTLLLKGVVEILVSVNPLTHSEEIAVLPNNDRVKYFYQSQDLGLYGNFLFLLKKASSRYFSWVCIDDMPTQELENMGNLARSSGALLVIPSWVRQEYYPEIPGHEGPQDVGQLPDLSTPKTTVLSCFSLDPSWIFGLWDSEFLLKIFPKKHFDGLDCILLQRVFLRQKIAIYKTEYPLIIGTWNYTSKIPYRVNSKKFSPWRAVFWQFISSLSFAKYGPRPFVRSLVRIHTLFKQFFELNRRLRG